jgi:hypothetical protein
MDLGPSEPRYHPTMHERPGRSVVDDRARIVRLAVCVLAMAGCKRSTERADAPPPATPTSSVPSPEPPAPEKRSFGKHRARAIAADGSHACAVLDNGEAWCWGMGVSGQLGDGQVYDVGGGQALPVRAVGVTDARAISAGPESTCVVREDATLSCWGAQITFEEHGSVAVGMRPRPMPFPGLTGVRELVVGPSIGCVLLARPGATCWGHSTSRSLGLRRLTTKTLASKIEVRSVAAGHEHVCLLDDAGRVTCLGENDNGQLGVGDFTSRPTPTVVRGLSQVTDLVAAASVNCAKTASGRVSCWGGWRCPPLADCERGLAVQPRPKRIPALDSAVALALHDERVEFTRPDGTTWVLPVLDALDRPTTAGSAIRGVPRPVALALGSKHSCGLDEQGRVWCWGDNGNGQLGVGDRDPHERPVRVKLP